MHEKSTGENMFIFRQNFQKMNNKSKKSFSNRHTAMEDQIQILDSDSRDAHP